MSKGERHGRSKLDEKSVVLIREFLRKYPQRRGYQTHPPCQFLARWFGVSVAAISKANARKLWKDVADEAPV